mmetsp:Transcript_13605/g.37602  ORF Transcript_13605/g.37602 Transcript_13605/m.37602 type:complete len:149 (-) Transcript_13605:1160-1606(-)
MQLSLTPFSLIHPSTPSTLQTKLFLTMATTTLATNDDTPTPTQNNPSSPTSAQEDNIAADTKDAFQEQFPVGRVFDDMKVATEAAHKLSHAFGFTVARSGYKIMCSRGVPPRRSRRRSFHGGIWLGKMTTLVQRNLGSLLIVTQSFPL